MPRALTIDVRKRDPVMIPDPRPLRNQYSVVHMQLFVITVVDPSQDFRVSATRSLREKSGGELNDQS